MIDDLFDGPWKILIVAIVVLVLFGSKKLPEAARSLGKSMRILKTEVQGLNDDEPAARITTTAQSAPAPAQPSAPASTADPQAQIAALQEQINNLKQTVAVNDTPRDTEIPPASARSACTTCAPSTPTAASSPQPTSTGRCSPRSCAMTSAQRNA